MISAPLGPLAVIAGAGSGKSETMAARLVWLVANGMVRPDRVLGLTFTRKAAAEFADRVRSRLERLRRAGLGGAAQHGPAGPTGGGPVRRGPGDRHLSRLRGPAGQRQRPARGPRAVHAADHPRAVLAARGADRGRLRRADGRDHLDAADGHRGRARAGRRPVRAPARHQRRHRRRPVAHRRARCAAGADTGIRSEDNRHPARQGAASAAGQPVRGGQGGARGARPRGPGGAGGQDRQQAPGGRGGRARPLPGGPARRVPGHQPRPAGAAAGAVRRRAPGDRGRRPVPVHLRLARRQRRQPAPVHRRLPGGGPGPAVRRLGALRAGPGAAAVHQLPQLRAGARRGRRHPGGTAVRGARRPPADLRAGPGRSGAR